MGNGGEKPKFPDQGFKRKKPVMEAEDILGNKKTSYEAPASFMEKSKPEGKSGSNKAMFKLSKDMKLKNKSMCEPKGGFSSRFKDKDKNSIDENTKEDRKFEEHKIEEIKEEKTEELTETIAHPAARPEVSESKVAESSFKKAPSEEAISAQKPKRRASDIGTSVGNVPKREEFKDPFPKESRNEFMRFNSDVGSNVGRAPNLEEPKVAKNSSVQPTINMLSKAPSFNPDFVKGRFDKKEEVKQAPRLVQNDPIQEVSKEEDRPDEKPKEERKGRFVFKPKGNKKNKNKGNLQIDMSHGKVSLPFPLFTSNPPHRRCI